MNKFLTGILFASLTIAVSSAHAEPKTHVAEISKDDSMENIVRKAANVVPTDRQSVWQKLEFTGFLHFTINTFTDKEWGDGTEDPSIFNPTELDARQWVKVCKDAGMKLIILTAKHHDGFCLWPSKLTEHSVRNSPFRGGNGDVVGEFAEACREAGMKIGIYLSPWDRNQPTYGDSPVYNEFFKNQLRELLTNYGVIDEVWFDGAMGEGPNGKRQEYDWPGYYKVLRDLQPHAVIAIMGPDVRWVGTESGYGRETEWSVVPVDVQDQEAIASVSQQRELSEAFRPKDMMSKDLGSREKIKDATHLIWYPSEVDVSIRPGWFYHSDQDDKVKTPEKLVDIHFSSIGRNSLLLLNIPPDRRGLIHENDIKSLQGMREYLDKTFNVNLASDARVKATSSARNHGAKSVIDSSPDTWWTTADDVSSADIELDLGGMKTFDVLKLAENILEGQRIERFSLEIPDGGGWKQIVEGTTVGYKRLLRFPAVTADKVRLRILESRTEPTLSAFGLYKRP